MTTQPSAVAATSALTKCAFSWKSVCERVRSGIAAAKARGQSFGRKQGYRPSDRHASEVIRLSESEKLSQRRIAEKLRISKTTVNEILKRYRTQRRAGTI